MNVWDGGLWLDVYRIVLAGSSLWMAMLLVRLCVRRWHDERAGLVDERTHPFLYLSYGAALVSLAVLMLNRLGLPPGVHIYIGTVVVVLGILGFAHRVRFSTRPPHRRR